MSRGGGSTEGLVNTALDIHFPSVPVCPSSSFPPSLYLDKNCEVVRFHLASQAHSDDFHPLNIMWSRMTTWFITTHLHRFLSHIPPHLQTSFFVIEGDMPFISLQIFLAHYAITVNSFCSHYPR